MPAMLRAATRALVPVILLAAACRQAPPPVPTPSDVLHLRIGGEGVLASYRQLVSYWRAIDRASDRITVQELGKTTAGLPYIVAIVTSPANQSKLEYYRDINNRLYDPRRTRAEEAKRLIAEGKTIVAIQLGIHATEVAAPQVSLELAYRFATDDSPRMRAVLENTIILLTPCHNPDGLEGVAEWNRKMAGTTFEGSAIRSLYNKYLYDDNNRDWVMFTQPESQYTVASVWNAWHPQISYDMHQNTPYGSRLFVPPYIDPFDPNVDPILRSETSAIGAAIATHLTSAGRPGVVMQANYDAWNPTRAYVFYHAGIKVLTEAATARLASPMPVTFDELGRGNGYDAKQASWNFPLPWRGGIWRLRDAMDYEHAAADALLDHAAKYRESWLTNFYRVCRNAIGRTDPATGRDKPYAVVVPTAQRDPASAFELLRALQMGDVEIHRAKRPFTAAGRSFAAGSHVVLLAQPAGAFAKTLTEVQHYPDLRQYPGGPPRRPYDVTAYTMPLLMGVETVTVPEAFTAELELERKPMAPPPGTVSGRATQAYLFRHDNAGIMALNQLAKAGIAVEWSPAFAAGEAAFPDGTIVVRVAGQPAVHEAVARLARTLTVEIVAVNEPVPPGRRVRLPRVGLYTPYADNADEGWTAWIFDRWGLPFTALENASIRAGNLRARYDAIVLQDQSPTSIVDGLPAGAVPPEYAGGIGAEGVAALEAFAKQGGTLIALNASTLLPIERFGLPVKNALDGLSPPKGGRRDDPMSAAFYAPGPIVRTKVDVPHPVAAGAGTEVAALFQHGPAFEVRGNAKAILTFAPPTELLLSGWLLGGEKMAGKAALVEAPIGEGRVILFGFRPQYRAQAWSTIPLLFNALYYAASVER